MILCNLFTIALLTASAVTLFAQPEFITMDLNGSWEFREAGSGECHIGDRVCMIGGFDQFHFFTDCTPAETRAQVRRCFNAAAAGGGFILSPSDHFFEAELGLVEAFADEARRCVY